MKTKLTPELAEAIGVLVADGCIQKSYICVWGNIREDRQYFYNHLVPLFSRLFNKKINAHEKKSNSVYGFYLCSKEVVSFLSENFGLTPGTKTYDVKIPAVILDSDDDIICSFIRGFADCDGCLTFDKSYGNYIPFKRTHNHYPRIILISVSEELVRQLYQVLTRLGFKCHLRIEKPKSTLAHTYRIFLKGPHNLELWTSLIGFNNPVQSSRYLIWKKLGFCPTKITLLQRQKLLKGHKNP
ncbi:hypothetical protein JW711_03440 [Candidatus Woesearchaeota archaeon]|nr:hypothetical protein [Candidatus Woesearchaeota archaeon]